MSVCRLMLTGSCKFSNFRCTSADAAEIMRRIIILPVRLRSHSQPPALKYMYCMCMRSTLYLTTSNCQMDLFDAPRNNCFSLATPQMTASSCTPTYAEHSLTRRALRQFVVRNTRPARDCNWHRRYTRQHDVPNATCRRHVVAIL